MSTKDPHASDQPPKKVASSSAKDDRILSIPNLVRDPTSRRYLPTSRIGAGGFATVWRAKVADGKATPESPECALKVVRTQIKSSQLRQRFQFELGIHNKLRHPNIVAFYRAFAFEDLTYVALELCEHGSLTDVIKRRRFLTMPEIRRYTIQLAGAIAHLHSRDVVHRDIKAGNVFLDASMNVKLGDFGLATCLEPNANDMGAFQRRTTFCGTPNYLAPELLSRRGHAAGVDIWALGILIYYLAVGAAPFHSASKEQIYERVRRQDYAWPSPSPDSNEIPPALRSLVASILVPEDERPSLMQIVQHPFIEQGFVPDRIDALARSRRPRWPRVPAIELSNDLILTADATSRATYLALVKASFQTDAPALESVLLSVQRELDSGLGLQVPMRSGIVILPFASQLAATPTAAPPKRKRAHKKDSSRARPQYDILLDADAGVVSEEDAGKKPKEDNAAAAAPRPVPEEPHVRPGPLRALMSTSGNRVKAAVRSLDAKRGVGAPRALDIPIPQSKPLAARPRTLRSASAKEREAMVAALEGRGRG